MDKIPKLLEKSTATTQSSASRKLGLPLLSAIIFASMVGGGAFNLPQNMAHGAGLKAVTIAWVITFTGMFFLSAAFRALVDKRPDLKAGIYSYAREGFGLFAGFEMAWGYWLAAVFGNVAFAFLLVKTAAYFFPPLATQNSWPSMTAISALIWVMHFIALSGVRRAAVLNLLSSTLNIVMMVIALGFLALAFDADVFVGNWGGMQARLGGLSDQVKSTMLVTLWVFIGIEGAVVVSGRAARSADVGRATLISLIVCTGLYFLISVLPFGLMRQGALAGLATPSLAYVLERAAGEWGMHFMLSALLISLLSSWLSWTILTAELPHEGAKDGVFPRFLAQQNRHHAAVPALWVSSVTMQLVVIVTLFAEDAWMWLISMTGVMILPSYLASTAFLWRLARQTETVGCYGKGPSWSLCVGVSGTAYALWLLYAAGLQFLLLSTILYAFGVPVFWWARRERASDQAAFSSREKMAVALLGLLAVGAVVFIVFGFLSLG
ncbi:basic amino acid/polyamine antiporter [Herbaspirillum sp. RTI4]|uniref:basic amino acid/polyamine antiporter n=1 Tax=Herbaspirillum sp. RTI4 TaxID=3048640 RepID=UPI002AB5BDEB|nr:basic amino acid/polyamine antiporter [Herbaspirillum sp. RTI4]MDY7578656.1 basic amino acid/polyamine antiporter [Herbaspirillum sp. RTI4]MEA9980646.1 basic amino acid/polyamine antiporter [Herbaspirillum sp. RTI4]